MQIGIAGIAVFEDMLVGVRTYDAVLSGRKWHLRSCLT